MYSPHGLIRNLEVFFSSDHIELPGLESQMKMAPSTRNTEILKRETSAIHHGKKLAPPRKSAVLILFYPKKDSYYIAFIKRAPDNSVHSKQISFPGGKHENADTSIVATALREANEEIGINTNSVKILGQLSSLYIPPSNFDVYPFIGTTNNTPSFRINQEVDRLIEVKIETLINKKTRTTRSIDHNSGQSVIVPCFVIDNEIIWGATAMIVSELIDILNPDSKP